MYCTHISLAKILLHALASFLLDLFPRRGDRPMFPSVFFIISYAFCSFSLPPGGALFCPALSPAVPVVLISFFLSFSLSPPGGGWFCSVLCPCFQLSFFPFLSFSPLFSFFPSLFLACFGFSCLYRVRLSNLEQCVHSTF